jgi:hypothetical protein
VKQIKVGEYKKAVCSLCALPTPAKWRSSGIGMPNMYVCDGHQGELMQFERGHRDDGYMTEADHQTWGRL